METSAKTGDSVEEAFLKCSKTILAKIETGELDPERIGSGKAEKYLHHSASFSSSPCNSIPRTIGVLHQVNFLLFFKKNGFQ